MKKASEQVHVQLNLPDLKTAVVNNTPKVLENLLLRARVYSLDGRVLFSHEERVNAGELRETDSFALEQAAAGLVFVKLELLSADGKPISDNFYWYAAEDSAYRGMNQMAVAKLNGVAKQASEGDAVRVSLELRNPGKEFAVMSKLTLRNADGTRVLPAYYSDNYISLLPGETRRVEIECPAKQVTGKLEVGLSGWNVQGGTVRAR